MFRFLMLWLALLVSGPALAEGVPASPMEQIGRLAAISGAVNYRATADAAATEAGVNFPLTTGNRIATPPRAHATVDIAAGRFYLDGDSAMTIGPLGLGRSAVTLEQGALILRILPGGAGQVFVIETPRGAFRADQPGYFEIEVAAGTGAVTVSALEGGAQFDDTTVLPPGTQATIAPGAAPVFKVAVEDDFIRRVAAEIAEAGETKLEAPSHVSPQTTGFNELQRYGLWVATERYGWVWEPQVTSDWTPFRNGRWVELAPWGRTWIDDAPWGFAPSHYGSWSEVNDRWVWLPGNAAQVSVNFFGTQTKSGDTAVNWVPLGPEQPLYAAAPVIVNNVRVISPAVVPKVESNTTINNTTNVTNIVKENRRPALVVFPGRLPPPTPPTTPPPSPTPSGVPNLSGLGAAGAPMQGGVAFPGRR